MGFWDDDMRVWETDLVTVAEVEFDADLHAFEVYDKQGKYLGMVSPACLEDMDVLVLDLDNGSCPVGDGWEDGAGNTCCIEGWGDHLCASCGGSIDAADRFCTHCGR